MEAIRLLIGGGLIIIGIFFCVVGIIGMIRMPDVYSRVNATGKVSTMGLMSLLAGSAFILPEVTLKALVLMLFLLITSPVASHAIANAAYKGEVPMVNPHRDDLATRQKPNSVN